MGKTAFIKTVLGWDDTQFKAGAAAATATVKKLNVEAERAGKGMKETGSSASKAGMGMMALGNAIDDVQYGFRGVVNNVPQVITMLGGSAGLAGAAIIAAVAFNQLQQWMDKEDSKDRGSSFKKYKEAIDKAGESVKFFSEYLADAISKNDALAESMGQVIDAQMELAKAAIETGEGTPAEKAVAEANRQKGEILLKSQEKLRPQAEKTQAARSELDRMDAIVRQAEGATADAAAKIARLKQEREELYRLPVDTPNRMQMLAENKKQQEAASQAQSEAAAQANAYRAELLKLGEAFDSETRKLTILQNQESIVTDAKMKAIDLRAASAVQAVEVEQMFAPRIRPAVEFTKSSEDASGVLNKIFNILSGAFAPAQ